MQDTPIHARIQGAYSPLTGVDAAVLMPSVAAELDPAVYSMCMSLILAGKPPPNVVGHIFVAGTQIEPAGVNNQERRDKLQVLINVSHLGGDSISQLTLAARPRSLYRFPITVRDIICNPFLGEMAALIEERQTTTVVSSRLNPGKTPPPLQPLGFTHLSSAESTSFNVPYMARLCNTVDIPKTVALLDLVLNRHRVLRSLYVVRDDRTIERMIPEAPIIVATLSEDGEEIDPNEIICHPFDLSSPDHLVRAVVSSSVLVLNISHTFGDLTTLKIVLKQITVAYNGCELSPIAQEYFDVTPWTQVPPPGKPRFWSSYLNGLDLN
ncbi:hypothetical protein BBP40_009444 [Aspergillus hancockii]|nr:hypothetical protein BBP40_009444 [Aspergillus hancockii]